jgi:anthranilate phosphoribosyltransferase
MVPCACPHPIQPRPALLQLGMKKALVVHSMGLDELTPMGPADVVEVSSGGTKRYSLDPLSVGIPRWVLQGWRGWQGRL